MNKDNKKPVKEYKICLRLKDKQALTLDKLKDKLNCKAGSKALIKAAELLVANDYESKVKELENEIISYQRILHKFLTTLNDMQNIENTINSDIEKYLPKLNEEIDRLKLTGKYYQND